MFALPAGPLVRWRAGVIAVWTALALLFAPRATHVQQVLALRGGASETTESARASELLKQAFPSPFADYVAIVVHGPVRWTNQRFGVVLDTLKAATERRPYVSQVISVRSIGESTFVSRDRRTTFLIAALTPEFTSEINKSVIPDLRDKIRSALAQAPGADGFEVKLTGFPALDHDVRTISAEDTERGEAQALPLTLVVLVVAFGALVAAMLPVIVGVLAITIALGLVTVAAHYLPMSVFVLNITTMVGLGVGIDYSLLIVTRFREELNRGLSPVDAAVRTIETAGSAVVTSGITVVVGFAALVMTPLSDTRSVGVGGLLVVLAAVLLATTFLPALLAVLGRNIDRPRWLARPLARFHAPTGWERWARWLGHRPWRAVAFGGVGIGLLTFPLTRLRLGLPATNWFPPESESGQGLAALRAMGASGAIQPIRVVVQFPEGEAALSGRRLPGLKALTDSLRKDPRVREVRGVASIRPGLSTLQLAIYYSDPAAARAKNAKFFDAYLSADQRITLLDVIPADTVSLAGMMDVARHVRTVIAHGVRGLTGAEGVRAGRAGRSDLGGRPGAGIRDRVRVVDGLRGVPPHARKGSLRQDRPERPCHDGGPLRDRVDDYQRRAHHDPRVRHVRVRPGPGGTARGLRPRGGRAAGRDAHPHGVGAGDHAHRGEMELVARGQGTQAGAGGRHIGRRRGAETSSGPTERVMRLDPLSVWAPRRLLHGLTPAGVIPRDPSATPALSGRSSGPSAACTATTPAACPARPPAPAGDPCRRSRDGPWARRGAGDDEAKRRRRGRSTSPRGGA